MFKYSLMVLFAFGGAAAMAEDAHLSPEQEQTISEAFKAVLLDPESGMISGLAAAESANGTLSVCGYINAKNRFGGYTGKVPFFGTFRDARFEVRSVGQDSDSLQQVMNRCQMFGIWN